MLRHRKHGGLEGLAKSLSTYDRYYTNFSRYDEATRLQFEEATSRARIILDPGYRATVRSIRYFRMTSSSSGAPYFRPKNEVAERLYHDAECLRQHIVSTPEKAFADYVVPPVFPALKSVPKEIEKGFSTRGVWMFPAVITLLEAQFGTSLYSSLLRNRDYMRLPLMHGRGAFNKARSFMNSIDVGEGVRVSDWVKGDSQVPPWLIRLAKSVLEGFIDFSTYEFHRVDDAAAAANKRVWDFVWWYFINTPIVFNDVLFRKSGGVPSGSLFTLLSWCVVSVIVNLVVTKRVEGSWLESTDIVVCGDDSAVRVKSAGRSFDEYHRAASEVGVLWHPAPKSSLNYWPNASSAQTLSTQFHDGSRLVRDTTDLLARCAYPTRYVSSREESVGRVLMVSMSVCNTDPVVHGFASFYATYKAAYLKAPIFVDKELVRYFRYVLGRRLKSSATLGDLMKPFGDTLGNLVLFANT